MVIVGCWTLRRKKNNGKKFVVTRVTVQIVKNVKEKMDRCINKAISYVEDLIDLYDSNTEITDIDLCHIIEILKGRE